MTLRDFSCLPLVVPGFFATQSIRIFYPPFPYSFSWKSGQVLYLNNIEIHFNVMFRFRRIQGYWTSFSLAFSPQQCVHVLSCNENKCCSKKVEGYAHENAVWIKTPLSPKCIFNFASVQKSSMKIKNGSPSQQHNSKTHVADVLLETQFWWEY